MTDGVEIEMAAQQERAEIAFAIDQELKGAIARSQAGLWDIAEQCYLFSEARGWLDLGIDGLEEYLAQPEVGMSRASFYKFVRTWRSLVIERQIPAQELRQLEMSKVALIAPKIISNEVTSEEALADAKSLAWSDLRERYIGSRPDKSAGLTSGREDVVDVEARVETPVELEREIEDALAGIEFDEPAEDEAAEDETVDGAVVDEPAPEDDPEYEPEDEIHEFEVLDDGDRIQFDGEIFVRATGEDELRSVEVLEDVVAIDEVALAEMGAKLALAEEEKAELAGRVNELSAAVDSLQALRVASAADAPAVPAGQGAATLAAMGGDREDFELAALNEASEWNWKKIEMAVQSGASYPRLEMVHLHKMVQWRAKYSI